MERKPVDPDAASASIDEHIAARIRRARRLADMTQEKLGRAIGTSAQQIQKYESGTNRVSAALLGQLARTMALPISYFYEGSAGPEPSGGLGLADRQDAFGDEPEKEPASPDTDGAAELLRLYWSIRAPAVRQQLLAMVRALVATQSS